MHAIAGERVIKPGDSEQAAFDRAAAARGERFPVLTVSAPLNASSKPLRAVVNAPAAALLRLLVAFAAGPRPLRQRRAQPARIGLQLAPGHDSTCSSVISVSIPPLAHIGRPALPSSSCQRRLQAAARPEFPPPFGCTVLRGACAGGARASLASRQLLQSLSRPFPAALRELLNELLADLFRLLLACLIF